MTPPDDNEITWTRFDLDTPQEVIDQFIEANVAECVEDAREHLIECDPDLTEAQLNFILKRTETTAREMARTAFAKAFAALVN